MHKWSLPSLSDHLVLPVAYCLKVTVSDFLSTFQLFSSDAQLLSQLTPPWAEVAAPWTETSHWGNRL